MKIEKYVLLVFAVITVGFLLGWLFPVEGPIDYIYDDHKMKKCAVKLCPPQEVPEAFTEEELDYINEILEEISEEQKE